MFHRLVSNLPLALALGSLCVVLLAPVALGAEEAEAAKAAKATPYEGFAGTACEAEFKELCSTAVSDSTAYSCLRTFAKRKALSAECTKHTEDLRDLRHAQAIERQNAWKKACATDIPKFCAEFADGKPVTIKGCLGKRRDELSESCNAKLPFRPGYKGKGRVRWRDGSEPDDWELKNALADRPRKTQEEIEEAGGVEAWKAKQEAKRARKDARNKKAKEALREVNERDAATGKAEAAADAE